MSFNYDDLFAMYPAFEPRNIEVIVDAMVRNREITPPPWNNVELQLIREQIKLFRMEPDIPGPPDSIIEDHSMTWQELLAKVALKFTTQPLGSWQISQGVQGYVEGFIIDMMRGDYEEVADKVDDIDNLTSNLLLYLMARGVSKQMLERMQLGYINPKNGEFVPDMTLMYQFSYVLKNQLSDMVWEGYSKKYTGGGTEYYKALIDKMGGFTWRIRDWSYSKHGNTLDAPASGGWMKSKFGDYYIRKNLY